MGYKVGELVGYRVRFDEKLSYQTKIKFLTDGMLLREAILDPNLSQYSVIILDEAHERTVNSDVLMALVKQISKARVSDFRLVVMSATLDLAKF
jgi:HrpA-like RNA helicase